MTGLYLGTCTSNLKSVTSTFCSYWHLTPKNLGFMWPWPCPIFLSVWGHVRTVPGNIHVKLEVCSFRILELLTSNNVFQASKEHWTPRPRFNLKLTYFTKWTECPILTFCPGYLVTLASACDFQWTTSLQSLTNYQHCVIVFALQIKHLKLWKYWKYGHYTHQNRTVCFCQKEQNPNKSKTVYVIQHVK